MQEAITELVYLFVIEYCDSMLIKHWKFTPAEILSSCSPRLRKRKTSSPVIERPVSWEMGSHAHRTLYRLTEGVSFVIIHPQILHREETLSVCHISATETFHTVNKYKS